MTAASYSIYRMSPDWQEMRQLDERGVLVDTEAPNVRWLDFYLDAADRSQVLAAINEAIREKRTFELEHRVRRAGGSFGWTLSRAVPILDDDGEVIEWFGAASDVTDRRLAGSALREQEEQLRLATDAAEIGFWVVDHVNDKLFWPPRVKAMFGIPPEVEVSMADFYAGLHPEDRDRISVAFCRVRSGAPRALRRGVPDGRQGGRRRALGCREGTRALRRDRRLHARNRNGHRHHGSQAGSREARSERSGTHRDRHDCKVAQPCIAAMPPSAELVADKGCDSQALRDWLNQRGTEPVIPPRTDRKIQYDCDRMVYRQRNTVERMFCRLKDWRRIATRHDRNLKNFMGAIALAATVIWWL